jgi:hypothetical protein
MRLAQLPDMSSAVVTTSYLTIVIIGVVGVWLGSVAVDSTDMRRWIGLAALIAAVVGMVVMYMRHVRPTQREKEIAWEQIRSRGKRQFVLRQVLVSQAVWFPILFGAAYELYKTGSLTALSTPPRWWYVIAASNAVFSFVWSLASWRRQEKNTPTNERRITNRWTRAAGACSAS